MKKAIIAGVAAAAIAGSSAAVYAQHRSHHHERLSMQDRSAFIDARIAAVKAGLQLTQDQEKMWPPLEAAVRDYAKQRMDRANARASERDARRAEREQGNRDDRGPQDRSTRAENRDPVARIRERADMMSETGAALKRIADAADPLYQSLDSGQKRRVGFLTRMGGDDRGWRGREFDRDIDRGGDRNRDGDRSRDRDNRGNQDGPQRL